VRAADLAAPYPTVRLDSTVLDAARLMAAENLPGLVVVDDEGRPVSVLPGTQVLRLAVPGYVQEDPTLARVIDEASADAFLERMDARDVASCLAGEKRELPVVQGDETVLEVAALMARARSPLVAVVDDDGVLVGVITTDALLDRMLSR